MLTGSHTAAHLLYGHDQGVTSPGRFSLTITIATVAITTFSNNGYTNLASPVFTTVTGTAGDPAGVTSVAIRLMILAGD